MLAHLGVKVQSFASSLGQIFRLLTEKVHYTFHPPFPLRSLVTQMVKIGWDSLPVIFFTAVATGAILALQTAHAIMTYITGAEQFVGGVVALAVTRELGPILCAIMVAGRAGSGITAEIGSMKVTEQIDALVTLSCSPVHFLVVPRVLAGMVMLPVLTIFTNFIAIIGGYVVSVYELNLNASQYMKTTLDFLEFGDVAFGLLKAFVFGIVITLLASYHGFKTAGGAEGVGKATTKAVVSICMSILFFDYVLTSLFTVSF